MSLTQSPNLILKSTVIFLTMLLCTPVAFAQEDDGVRGGLCVISETGEAIEMPLTGLSVRAQVDGNLASVEVEQVYENPFDERIEAVYVFPLPKDSAVTDLVMVIGERRIRADLQEREEARRTYEAARDRGQTTSLLEQERPNIFTQSVANIDPGYPVHVLITYVEQLPYSDGGYHFNFPMVVGPRYIPGTPIAHAGTGVLHDTDRVADASRITPPVLPEDVRAPYQVDFTLDLDAGIPIRELISTSHEIDVVWTSDEQVTISLPVHERDPDRDVVISYNVAESAPEFGILTHYDERGGFFSLSLEPPATVAPEDIRPRELIFVVDTSGSMSGQPLDASKDVIREALSHLNPDDTFQIIRFGDAASTFSAHPVSNTPTNVAGGLAYVDSLSGGGGTNMELGIRAALEPPTDPDRMRIVLFLTDGYIGHEADVLELIDVLLGEARLFSLGVGSSPNRFLLDKMSEVGRGAVTYVNIDEDPTEAVEQFYNRFANPILTDIEVDWAGLGVYDVSPTLIPDVFEGNPIVLTGRYDHSGTGTVTISGRQGLDQVEYLIDVQLVDEPVGRDAIPYIWARRQVDAIESTSYWRSSETVRAEVLPLALEFGLLTQYTSFVAVEERVVADADDPLRTFAVAVPLPEGVSEEGIGVQVSPQYVQPGDPEISVCSHADTIAVTAYFPFDLVQNLDLDSDTGCWLSRFLVPRDVPDGEYSIFVIIEREGGVIDYREVPLWVDSTAPIITAQILPGNQVSIDDVITFHVDVLQPTPTCVSNGETDTDVCAEVLPESMKFIRLYLPDGREVRMEPVDELRTAWEFDYRIRDNIGTGLIPVLVEAVDDAGNSTLEIVEICN